MNKAMSARRIIWAASVIAAVFAGSSYGEDKGKFDFSRDGSFQKVAGVPWSKKIRQGYAMRVWMSNCMTMGIQAWDPSPVPIEDCSVGIGADYPVGSCIEHLYGAGPWIGGIINGKRYVDEGYNGDDARSEFIPERWDTARDRIWHTHTGLESYDPNGYSGYYMRKGIQVNRRGYDDDGDGKIDEDELDGLDNDGDWSRDPVTHALIYDDKGNLYDDIGADGLADSEEVSCDGKAYDAVTNPDPAYDNYDRNGLDKCHYDGNGNYLKKNDKNRYTQNNGIPDHGEPHVDEDYGAVSDKDYYITATDTFKSFTVGGHAPMGVKVFQKVYSWDQDFAEGVMPMDYYFINIGRNTIRDVYVGFFADMDVGPVDVSSYYAHDFACYFPDLRTAYIHNAQDRNTTPMGLTVLSTPRRLDSLQYVFQWHGFNEPGTQDSLIYSWMSGEAFPNQLIKPCQSPSSTSDTRFFFSFGQKRDDPTPSIFKEFKPGDTLKITVALVGGEAVDEGPNNLKENAEKAIKLAKRGFQPPINLPSPPLKVTEGFKKVKLEWGIHVDTTGRALNPLEVWDDSSQLAQSYPDTSWRRINPPCNIVPHRCIDGKLTGGRIFEGYRLYRSEDPNDQPNSKSWTLLKQFDLPGDAYEYNVGLDSVFVDSNLVRGKRYWYSVTSFGIPDITVLEIPDSVGVHYDTLYAQNAESPFSGNQQRVDLLFSAADTLGKVLVVPNPYRVDQDYTFESGGWEGRASSWTEDKRLVKFIHLPRKCTIRIFTLAGDQVTTLNYDAGANHPGHPDAGEIEWNLLSESGRALASGLYVFTVESDLGTQVGKFVLIR